MTVRQVEVIGPQNASIDDRGDVQSIARPGNDFQGFRYHYGVKVGAEIAAISDVATEQVVSIFL